MLERYKQQLEKYIRTIYDYVSRIRDIRVAGQVVFAVIVLLVTWSGIKAIDTNYSLEKQVATLQQQSNVQQLENSNIQLQNTYYQSNQYLELSARQNFGLAEPGEKELLVPQNVAMAYTVQPPKATQSRAEGSRPVFEQNLQAWLDFFLDRHVD